MKTNSSPSFHVVERGIVYSAPEQSTQRVACYPGLVRLSDGRILCGFRIGQGKDGADEGLRICQSSDEGQSWQPLQFQPDTVLNGVPGSLSVCSIIETAPGELLMVASWINRSDPALPISNPETAGLLEIKSVKFHSSDGGQTWSEIEEIAPQPFDQPEISGPVIALQNPQHLLLPMENQKRFDDPEPINEKCYALLSYDGGRTWPDCAMIAHDFPHRKFWCNRVAKLYDGTLACVSWAFDEATQKDLPLHITYGSPDGKTWSSPQSTGVEGQVSYLFPYDESTLLMATSHRESPAGIRLRRSFENGQSWEPEGVLVFDAENQAAQSGGDLGAYYQQMTAYSFGWSPMLRLNDGSILLAHFAGSQDVIDIHWVKIGAEHSDD